MNNENNNNQPTETARANSDEQREALSQENIDNLRRFNAYIFEMGEQIAARLENLGREIW
jgi:hypothetical protein